MIFNDVIGIQEMDQSDVKVIKREAVRGIILNNDNILMVKSNKGDYKFPGGGMKDSESHEETLIREIREETGYIVHKIEGKIGVIIERNEDKYDVDSIFEMTSYYYLCKVTDVQTLQQLDDYEKELGFHPTWIQIDKAIYSNENILKMDADDMNPWVYRENIVLKLLKDWITTIV